MRRVSVAVAVLAAALGAVPAVAGAQSHPSSYEFTDVWTRADALQIEQDESNTNPPIDPDFPVIDQRVWQWDTWPLTNLNSDVVTYKGWHVAFALTAPRSLPFPDRHVYAEIGYYISRDGKSWQYQGDLFPNEGLGRRQWAGSAILVGNRVYAYYTASGDDDRSADYRGADNLQRIAVASGTISADEDGVRFSGFDDHEILLEADGRQYQTLEQSLQGPIIYAFRDPFVFRDPEDGRVKMLFEGNTAGESVRCGPRELGQVPEGHVIPAGSEYYTGNIGLATARASMTSFRLRPPIMSANCTNQQLERPHLVVRDDRYYLFTISHMFTFAPGLEGPDGVYGFVGDGVRSDYEPLNGSGLVLGNPPDAPLQQYSHYVMPNGLVQSFIDTVPTEDGERYGGTLAPTVLLELDEERTDVVTTLDYGFMPATTGGLSGGEDRAIRAARAGGR